MLEILDSLIATIAVVMILSLVVQGIEQILKQLFSVKSKYMERELFALFRRHLLPEAVQTMGNRMKDTMTPVLWKLRSLKKESEETGAAVDYFRKFFASVGYDDLSLIEKMSGKEFGELVEKLIASLSEEIAATADRPDSPVGKLLRSVHAEMQNLHRNIENWFTLTLHAFQDHYERRMKMWSYAFSALVVIALNANIIAIHKEFSSNKVLRDAAVAAAENMVARDKEQVTGSTAGAPAADSPALPMMKKQWSQIDSLVSGQSFPIMRWNAPNGDPFRLADEGGIRPDLAFADFCSGFARNWIGWLGMILLVGLGAPFWYDLLRLVVGLKSTFRGGAKS